jgi:hypothetical protein
VHGGWFSGISTNVVQDGICTEVQYYICTTLFYILHFRISDCSTNYLFKNVFFNSAICLSDTWNLEICDSKKTYVVPFCGHLVYFSHFGMLYQEKSGKPGSYLFVCLSVCSKEDVPFSSWLEENLLQRRKRWKKRKQKIWTISADKSEALNRLIPWLAGWLLTTKTRHT